MTTRNRNLRNSHGHTLVWLGLAAAAGCGDNIVPEPAHCANRALGVDRFVIEETADRTEVRGLAADGRVVAKLDLVHGWFEPTGVFRSEYVAPRINGRKLDIAAGGHTFVWETEGFTPTLKMPPHPADRWAIKELVEDPQVKPLLDRWLIGFAPPPTSGEHGGYTGWDEAYCTSEECGQVRGLTISMCGGSGNATEGVRINERNLFAPGDSVRVLMCCPAGTGVGNDVPWFGNKTCPTEGTVSECGVSEAACKGCGVHDASYVCDLETHPGEIHYTYSADNWGVCGAPESCCEAHDCLDPNATCENGVCSCQ